MMKKIIKFKRRIACKTNYRRRLGLLKSGRIRLVIRKSLSNISVQFVNFKPEGDETMASAVSSELKKLGWTRSGNLPAAYLTGLLAGKKAKEKDITEAILDLGIQNSTKGSRIYAALKGALDAGVNIPHSDDILPSDERIKGEHISKDVVKQFEEVKKKIGV
jgi:large subunit ribosomal protein L18